jgi:hypothetical protein
MTIPCRAFRSPLRCVGCGSIPAQLLPPFQAALPEPVRKATPFCRSLGVKRRDEEQEQEEIRDRVPQVFHKERAARDSD